MPLIQCPDCLTDCSDLARSCVKCGRPFRRKSKEVITTQRTSKHFKAWQAFGVLLFGVGGGFTVASCADADLLKVSLPMIGLGIVSIFYGIIGAWWNHG